MKGQGEINIAWRKKYNPDDRNIIIGFHEFVFAHEAEEGDTEIDLLNLVKPIGDNWDEFDNPSIPEILDSKIALFKNNLRLTRSAGGMMLTGEYRITDNNKIELITPALSGEIFEGKFSYAPKTNKTVEAIPTYTIPDFDLNGGISDTLFKEIFDDATFTISNIKDGRHFVFIVQNSDINRHTIQFPSNVGWNDDSNGIIGVEPNTVKALLFIRSGAYIIGRVLHGSVFQDNISLKGAQTYSVPVIVEAAGTPININCDSGNNFNIELSAPTEFNITNAKVGGIYSLYIHHVGQGNTITWDAGLNLKIANGSLDIGYINDTYNIITISCIDTNLFLISYSADYY